MARFNRPTAAVTAPVAPIRTTGATAINHQGGAGFERTSQGELFLLAVNYLDGEGACEKQGDTDNRFRALVAACALAHPVWTYELLVWLRRTANLRTVAQMGAVEFVHARLAAKALGAYVSVDDTGAPTVEHGVVTGVNRAAVNGVLWRADEPGEMIAYWKTRGYGPLPKPLKRGIADGAARLYTERSFIKWDSAKNAVRFADVIELTHPKTADKDALFTHILDDRHHSERASYEALPVPATRKMLFAMPQADRAAFLRNPYAARELGRAGMTWEQLASWLGRALDAQAWETMLPTMGLMAVIRNARNMDQAKVSDEALAPVFAKLTDADEVANSRMLPFRFLSAFQHASLRWHYPLDRALSLSLANVPSLSGHTLILVDRSGTMWAPVSGKSELNRADTAALFGSALALRAAHADLVQFGTSSAVVPFKPTDSPLQLITQFGNLGGTYTAQAVQRHFKRGEHTRVILLTDEQAAADGDYPLQSIPAHVPVYTWNLAGYRYGHAPTGVANRYTSGGLSDASFSLIPIREAALAGTWPWAA